MTKEEREEILNNHAVLCNSQKKVERYEKLMDFDIGWSNSCNSKWYFGKKENKRCYFGGKPEGHVFNSVDEFEAFLKDDPAPSETKFKVGDKVKIVANSYNHSLDTGDIAIITRICSYISKTGQLYKAEKFGTRDYSYITNECAELYQEPEQNPKGRGYGENECILVNNITDFNEICKITGFNNDAKYMGNITSGEDTCIYIRKDTITWSSVGTAKLSGCNIIPAQDFIEAHSKEVIDHEKPLLKGEYKSVRKWHTDKLLDRRFGNALKAQGDGIKGVNTKYLEVWDETPLNKLTCKPKEKPLDLSTRRIRKHT